MLIDLVGTFLGFAPIHGVDTSSGGFPQLILQCEATHYYDPEVEDYVEVEDQELRAYLVLYGSNGKPIRNCEQVKKVFGWDGASFQTLAEMDLSQTRFLFRTKENTYKENTTIQVDWIDVDTASPTNQISSLDAKALQSLDAKFGLAKVGKKTNKPKPTGKPTVPKASTKKKVSAEKTKVEKKTTDPQQAVTAAEAVALAQAEATSSIPSGPPKPVTPTDEPTGSTTREQAWVYIEDEIPEVALPADKRAEVWEKAIITVHGGPDDDTLTGVEWFKVQQLIVSDTIPF